MSDRSTVIAAILLALAPAPALAQEWRDVTSFRQQSAESRLDVAVRYGAGTLVIRPGTGEELYRVGMRYDSDVFRPVTDYRDGRLEVGVEGTGRGMKLKNTEGGDLTLSLSPRLPLELDLDFGAVEADLELGGLRIASLDIETGASDTEVGFRVPNPIECESLEISMGAAAFAVRGLGNANCRRIQTEGGVGDLTLDFSGDWRRDMTADITMALGSVKLVVPENVGVRVDKDTFLTDFDGHRFHKRDGTHYSDNWESAERRLTVDLEGAFGSFEVRWSRAAGATP